MSEPSWLEKLYLGAKRTIKTGYQRDKEGIKEVLNFFGCDSDSDIYKFMAKTAHIGEPIFSGITETAEFVAKNVDETGYLMSDMIGWAVEGDSIDSRRLLNYLYKYSQETNADMMLLLNELPPQSLSDVMKYANEKLSEMKKIPCSKVCMDIALSQPNNIHEENYWTADSSRLDSIVAGYKDTLSGSLKKQLDEKLPLIEFKEGSPHSQMLEQNDTVQNAFKEWLALPDDKKGECLVVTLNSKSDSENGYDAYATFHRAMILSPTVDEHGNVHAYVYDVYDFERASFNGQMLDFATIMAHHLQESGHLQNYKMIVPITISAEELNKTK